VLESPPGIKSDTNKTTIARHPTFILINAPSF
jgi:hypothetical protein